MLFLFLASALAQTITLDNASIDLNGCADSQGTLKCYNTAEDSYTQAGRVCNGTTSNRGNCLAGATVTRNNDVMGCLTAGCWNKAYSCDWQLMGAQAYYESDHDYNLNEVYPFSAFDYKSTPGSCVCNMNVAVFFTAATEISLCGSSASEPSCLCCAAAVRVAAFQSACPHNSLDFFGISNTLKEIQNYAAQYCPGFQQSNWQDVLNQQCPSSGVNSKVLRFGFANPLSLSSGFPGTTSLSNIPGSITALSQLNLSSTVAYAFDASSTTTITYASFNAAATPTGAGNTVVSTVSAQVTTVNGQATTIPPTVVTSSKTGSAARVTAAIGLLAGLLVL